MSSLRASHLHCFTFPSKGGRAIGNFARNMVRALHRGAEHPTGDAFKGNLASYLMRGCRTWTYDLQIMSLARFPTSLTRKTVSKSREINKGKTLLKEVYKHRFWFIKISLIIKLNIRDLFLSCLLHPKEIPRPVRSNFFGEKSKVEQVWGSYEAGIKSGSRHERGASSLYKRH